MLHFMLVFICFLYGIHSRGVSDIRMKVLLALRNSQKQLAFLANQGVSTRATIRKDKTFNGNRNGKSTSKPPLQTDQDTKIKIPMVPAHIWENLSEKDRQKFKQTRKEMSTLYQGQGVSDDEDNGAAEIADLALNFDHPRIKRATALMARVVDDMPPLLHCSDDDEPPILGDSDDDEAGISRLHNIALTLPQDITAFKTIDSGCSSHIWTNLAQFINKRPHKVQIMTASKGEVLYSDFIGDVHLKAYTISGKLVGLVLKRALYGSLKGSTRSHQLLSNGERWKSSGTWRKRYPSRNLQCYQR